ncbi:MAG: hypothetical protein M8357_00135 [Desulfobulbaceae bacterium]|nr:hypothetical protein [Desulfobulbaceae bacterium]
MNSVSCTGGGKAVRSLLYPVFFFFFLTIFVFVSGSPAVAAIPGQVSFAWQANPPEDNVIGYRLYYGGYSRFDSSGKPKSNFSYDYYIDFAELERCYTDGSGVSCRILSSEELQCVNLNRDVPTCTISNLHGSLYFALTAYNAQAESTYTPELNLTVNPEGLAAVRQAAAMLLLKK